MKPTKPYKTFQDFLAGHFSRKVQKISINAGFTCPNRDGSLGFGGCTYCNNQTFNPEYCIGDKSVTVQLEEGKRFFSKKYPDMDYLAYFQAYTNTYASFQHLKKLYEEALNVPGVVGLVIGTRPDCISDEILDYLQQLSEKYFILVEYGVETTLDRTLKFINRGHDFKCSSDAIIKTASKGINVGAHMILGLPGESENDILEHADKINKLPLDVIKLHQLQIIKGTVLSSQIEKNRDLIKWYNASDYAELVVSFIERLRPDIAVERFISQSPPSLLIAPNWGLKNYEFTHMVENKMKSEKRFQGSGFNSSL
jgi:radical SAM protein (TIGR01212 family)